MDITDIEIYLDWYNNDDMIIIIIILYNNVACSIIYMFWTGSFGFFYFILLLCLPNDFKIVITTELVVVVIFLFIIFWACTLKVKFIWFVSRLFLGLNSGHWTCSFTKFIIAMNNSSCKWNYPSHLSLFII